MHYQYVIVCCVLYLFILYGFTQCLKLYKCVCVLKYIYLCLHLCYFTQYEIMLHGFTLALICPKFYTSTNINENYTHTWDLYQKPYYICRTLVCTQLSPHVGPYSSKSQVYGLTLPMIFLGQNFTTCQTKRNWKKLNCFVFKFKFEKKCYKFRKNCQTKKIGKI